MRLSLYIKKAIYSPTKRPKGSVPNWDWMKFDETYRVDHEATPKRSRDELSQLYAAAPELLKVLKICQARLCERCPSGDRETNCGEHTDECLAAMDAITKAEGGTYEKQSIKNQ